MTLTRRVMPWIACVAAILALSLTACGSDGDTPETGTSTGNSVASSTPQPTSPSVAPTVPSPRPTPTEDVATNVTLYPQLGILEGIGQKDGKLNCGRMTKLDLEIGGTAMYGTLRISLQHAVTKEGVTISFEGPVAEITAVVVNGTRAALLTSEQRSLNSLLVKLNDNDWKDSDHKQIAQVSLCVGGQ